MNLIQKIRQTPKRFAALAALFVAGTATAAVMAWGPARQTFTMEQPADHVTFNSITNNPNYGDEREFVTIKDVTAGNQLTNKAELIPGHEYQVQIYVHNNAHENLNASGVGVAKDVTVRAALSASINGSDTVDGFVSASNATPKEVWDSALLTSTSKVDLEFINGSAMLHTNFQQTKLSDAVITTGVKVGSNDLSGKWNGCLNYAGAVTFRFKVKEQPKNEFTMDKQVRKHSTTTGGWVESYAAQPGETVDFIIRYKNTGNVTQENVIVKDTLPAGLTYVAGSTILANGDHPDGASVVDGVTTTGINIGTYAPGLNAWVRFSAKVADNDKLPVCGTNTLKNVASVKTSAGTKTDDAIVTVTKKCEEKMIEVCRLEDKKIVKIKESEFDSKKYSKDLNDCKSTPEEGTLEVCRLEDKVFPVTIKESEFDESKYSKDFNDCKEEAEEETPTEVPSTGPAEMLGSLMGTSALGYGAYTYAASRKAVRSIRK